MDLDSSDSVEGAMQSPEEEMGRDKPSGANSANHNHYSKSKSCESRRMVDITRDKPIKVAVRVVVPVRDHPKFNFVGKLLGPKGNSLKRLQEDTMCKMAVLGRGSMKDRHKEEELRASGDPKFQHLSEELHVEISAFATPAEAHARIAYALAEVRRFLVPDYNDDIRQEQMWEMQVLSSQRNNNKGDEGTSGGGPQPGAEYAAAAGAAAPVTAEDRLSETMPDSPEDEHPAMRGVQPGNTAAIPDTTPVIQMPTTNGAGQLSPTTNNGGTVPIVPVSAAAAAAASGRKRPLLTGGPRTSMTPTKRTVMSLLARARAAQAKQLPNTFQRGAAELCVSDALPVQWNCFEKPTSPRKIICRSTGESILERFEFIS